MAKKIIKLWYDPKGDYLEVIFEQKEGYFRETENDQVMEKVERCFKYFCCSNDDLIV